MTDGFKPITFNEFSKSYGDTWESVLDQDRQRYETLQKAIKYAREIISTNQECFVAQWVLQNQDKKIDDYIMCYQYCGDAIKFWMEERDE
jgi:hypothetical protein